LFSNAVSDSEKAKMRLDADVKGNQKTAWLYHSVTR